MLEMYKRDLSRNWAGVEDWKEVRDEWDSIPPNYGVVDMVRRNLMVQRMHTSANANNNAPIHKCYVENLKDNMESDLRELEKREKTLANAHIIMQKDFAAKSKEALADLENSIQKAKSLQEAEKQSKEKDKKEESKEEAPKKASTELFDYLSGLQTQASNFSNLASNGAYKAQDVFKELNRAHNNYLRFEKEGQVIFEEINKKTSENMKFYEEVESYAKKIEELEKIAKEDADPNEKETATKAIKEFDEKAQINNAAIFKHWEDFDSLSEKCGL
ncbi:hypothetical protein HYD_0700 [Candidatus Hydrogenosomobacter endosymbioticus]|uniref:Uncharacterized protein n=2 Tax=Candidatus Hydrogenosomobacter endosymbioticus TaxID=2558174 RepID=A0ABN6L307_9PROT|nr:hypothetical protein HYD_0700 [Candidatus Hydrogenosomobacter endosymbioticus]